MVGSAATQAIKTSSRAHWGGGGGGEKKKSKEKQPTACFVLRHALRTMANR